MDLKCTELCVNRAEHPAGGDLCPGLSSCFRVYGGFSPLFVLFLSQQLTNLAAVFAHCCISPNRYRSFLAFDMFSKPVWVSVI